MTENRQRQATRPEFQLAITNAQNLELPTTLLDSLIDFVEQHGEEAEAVLRRNRTEAQGSSGATHPFLAISIALSAAVETQHEEGAPAARYFGDLLETDELSAPDVTFRSHGADVGVSFESHMRAREAIEVRHAKSYYRWLLYQRDWQIEQLKTAYCRIAAHQRQFLTSLIPVRLEPLPVSHLPAILALPHSATTYYRLLIRRTVRICHAHYTFALPLRFLLPTEDRVTSYEVFRQLNRALVAEVASSQSVSDEGLSQLTRSARRTIAKYRNEAGIPPHGARKREYDNGRTSPFRAISDIEAFLPPQTEYPEPPLDSWVAGFRDRPSRVKPLSLSPRGGRDGQRQPSVHAYETRRDDLPEVFDVAQAPQYRIRCGRGWLTLLAPVIVVAKRHGVNRLDANVDAGWLVISTDGTAAELLTAIERAQGQSHFTCELCGNLGHLRNGRVMCGICTRRS